MKDKTHQMNEWSSDFGREYTDRNPQNSAEMDALYQENFGITRSALNVEFLDDLDRDIKILEVGANVGGQLLALQEMGFKNLYGVELQWYAVEKAKAETKNINLIQGTAFDVPFQDGYFDLVYTSGVLIHISPDDIDKAFGEVYRCSSRYIWGFEYYAPEYTTVTYRGQENLLWKANFAAEYMKRFSDLKLIKEKMVPYKGDDNVDQMYLMEKAG